jgi:ABC-type dipeptide/oligopeptide/nickel transport system permease component
VISYVLRRLAFIPFTLLLVAAATFVVLRLTGNPTSSSISTARRSRWRR